MKKWMLVAPITAFLILATQQSAQSGGGKIEPSQPKPIIKVNEPSIEVLKPKLYPQAPQPAKEDSVEPLDQQSLEEVQLEVQPKKKLEESGCGEEQVFSGDKQSYSVTLLADQRPIFYGKLDDEATFDSLRTFKDIYGADPAGYPSEIKDIASSIMDQKMLVALFNNDDKQGFAKIVPVKCDVHPKGQSSAFVCIGMEPALWGDAAGNFLVVFISAMTGQCADDFFSPPMDLSVLLAFGMKGKDGDKDAWLDSYDNCPMASNPDQADANDNGTGDACEEAIVATGAGAGGTEDTIVSIGAGTVKTDKADEAGTGAINATQEGGGGCSLIPGGSSDLEGR